MMNPLQPATIIRPPVKKFIQDCIRSGLTRDQAKQAYNEFTPKDECWRNELYVVLVRRGLDIPEDMNPERDPHLVWLSIRRDDRGTNIPWRHKQKIKNQLLGPKNEAVEIFPAESRLVDGANQYHLFGYTDGRRVPFGFQTRSCTTVSIAGSKQEPFE